MLIINKCRNTGNTNGNIPEKLLCIPQKEKVGRQEERRSTIMPMEIWRLINNNKNTRTGKIIGSG